MAQPQKPAAATSNGSASAPPPLPMTSLDAQRGSPDASQPSNPDDEANASDLPPFLAKIRASLPTSRAPASPDAPPIHGALYLAPPAQPDVQEDLIPPENFAAVTQGVYRSGFPKKRNFKFLETLQLKTVLTLVLEDYPDANLEWCQNQDIQFLQFGIPGNKEPFDNIPEDVICSALVTILDKRNHPLLIHCNKGKHRTGCLVGCVRRLQSWSLTSIFDEYRRFSAPKSRAVDQQFIDLFDLAPVWAEVLSEGGGLANLPQWRMLALPLSLATRKHEIEAKAREVRGERDTDDSGLNGSWRNSRPGREGRMSIGGANIELLDSPPVIDVGLEVVAQ